MLGGIEAPEDRSTPLNVVQQIVELKLNTIKLGCIPNDDVKFCPKKSLNDQIIGL